MSDIVINYFTGNNGFFLPDLKPIPCEVDLDELIFIESNPEIVSYIHSLINTEQRYSNYKNLKVFYYKLDDPTVVYRLLDFDPENVYFFLRSNGILFEKKISKEMSFSLDIPNYLFVADNVHRLMHILKDTKFSIFLPADDFIKKFIDEENDRDLLGLYFSEKFHLLHGKEIQNVELISFIKSIKNNEFIDIDNKGFNYIKFPN